MKERVRVTKLRGQGSFKEVFCGPDANSKKQQHRKPGGKGQRKRRKTKRPKPILVGQKLRKSKCTTAHREEPLSSVTPAETALTPERPKQPRRRRRYSATRAQIRVRPFSSRRLLVAQEDSPPHKESHDSVHMKEVTSKTEREARPHVRRTSSTNTLNVLPGVHPFDKLVAEKRIVQVDPSATRVEHVDEFRTAKAVNTQSAPEKSTAFREKRDLVQKMTRIKKNWDTVRAVARAAMSLQIMSSTIQMHNDIRHGIQGYSRFRRIIDLAPHKRTRSEQEFLLKATAELPFFKGEDRHSNHVTADQIYELCRIMHFETFPEPGCTVFEQGEESRFFYIIVEGSVSVNVRVDHDEDPQQVAVLTAGMTFGENAINRTGGLRSATIITEEPSSFITISTEDFMRILCAVSSGETKDVTRRLANVRAFQDLSEETLQRLAGLAKRRKLGLQDEAAVQGSPIDQSMVLMVIKRGEIMVQRHVMSKDQHGKATTIPWTMCILGHSEVLAGEPNFMQQTRHNCSFVANTLVELYTFSKHELFNNLSELELRQIESRLQPFPPLRYTQLLYDAATYWEVYKRLTVMRVTEKSTKQWTHGQLLRELRKRVHAGKPKKAAITPHINTKRRLRTFLHDQTELDALFINPKDCPVIEEFSGFTVQLTRQVYQSACNQSSLHFHFARPYLSKHSSRADAGSRNRD